MSKKIKVVEWSHPNWDSNLLLKKEGDPAPEAYLYEDDDRTKLKIVKLHNMTPEEIDELEEWEG